MTLTPRERVLAAINHQETDFVPYCYSRRTRRLGQDLRGLRAARSP